MSLIAFVILGLGGKELSPQHINETTSVLNQINPHNIRVMSLAVKRKTGLGTFVENGSFMMLSEIEMIEELRGLIEQLEGIDSRYGNYHSVNLLTELAGVSPKTKQNC